MAWAELEEERGPAAEHVKRDKKKILVVLGNPALQRFCRH